MPGQGVKSMFNFGQSFGILKGICSAMQLPMYFVRPTKWKKYFNLIRLKYFFHFVGLTKYIGNCIAEHIPFKIPND